MRIEVKGRGVEVGEELRRHVERRFEKVARQVSPLAVMEVEVSAERNPSISASQVAEATLFLKGVTLRARDASEGMTHAVNLVADEIARQVKRHRVKRRGRRAARAEAGAAEPVVEPALDGEVEPALAAEEQPALDVEEAPPPAT